MNTAKKNGKPGLSPAYTLLKTVWGASPHRGKSWRQLNAAMRSALKLAIESGLSVNVDDLRSISGNFRAA